MIQRNVNLSTYIKIINPTTEYIQKRKRLPYIREVAGSKFDRAPVILRVLMTLSVPPHEFMTVSLKETTAAFFHIPLDSFITIFL
jgi:hypothetical protein